MKFITAAVFAGIAAAAIVQSPPANETAWGVVYTTEVVTALTTYCPKATTFSHAGVTYTVTEVGFVNTTVYAQQQLTMTQATTLTITNCPCTITKSASSTPVAPVATTSSTPWPTTTAAPYNPPPPPQSTPVYPVFHNSTTVVTTVLPTGASVTKTGPQFTGAANHLSAAGAGIAALAGLVAALF